MIEELKILSSRGQFSLLMCPLVTCHMAVFVLSGLTRLAEQGGGTGAKTGV